jgi:hypothetical protein
MGIANTEAELVEIQKQAAVEHKEIQEQTGRAQELIFTSPGIHDEQLTTHEFFAWHRRHLVENAARITESRGRPKPGAEHPHAEPDDPDGAHGGTKPDEVEFGAEEGLPGGEKDADDADDFRGQMDPTLAYAARHPLTDEQLFDAVHRSTRQNGCAGARDHRRRSSWIFSCGIMLRPMRKCASPATQRPMLPAVHRMS